MENKKTEKRGLMSGASESIKKEIEKRKASPVALIYDVVVFAVAFLFSRTHIVLGSYPLGIAFVSFIKRGVWGALVGVVAGAFTMGKSGLIYAIISVIVVFLRVIISGGENKDGEEKVLFSESLALRICSSAVGAFVGAVYEMLLGAFSVTSILYGSVSVLLASVFTLIFSGIYEGGISFCDLINSRRDIFKRKNTREEKISTAVFSVTFLVFAFLISFSMKGYSLIGITPSYIFATALTLFVAKRFGTSRAIAVGFVASLPVGSLYSVAFALVGLGAGFLFKISNVYALIGGGIMLSVWSFYVGDVVGFLSTFPEYVCASLLCVPILRKAEPIRSADTVDVDKNDAGDMVTASALLYKSSPYLSLDALEVSLGEIAKSLYSYGRGEGKISYEEYKGAVLVAVREFCLCCGAGEGCITENPAPFAESIDLIADKLYRGISISEVDVSTPTLYCKRRGELYERIKERVATLEKEKARGRTMELCAREYELLSTLFDEARAYGERERTLDSVLSKRLEGALYELGFDGVVKAFGTDRHRFIGASEDSDGSIISSPKIRECIERVAGVRVGKSEYFRKGNYALFECSQLPSYKADFYTLFSVAEGEGASGDTSGSFECVDGHFYALISDGMGSGEVAERTSRFVYSFLSSVLNTSCKKGTALSLVNHIIRERGEECSATVDLFEFNLFTGEATFYKCGAVASYVLRGSSVFRVRSESAPIGVMNTIDAERIKVEVKAGDFIVMISDGVSQSIEDGAWLYELLSNARCESAQALTEKIMALAREKSHTGDDMSVAVVKIIEEEKGEAVI